MCVGGCARPKRLTDMLAINFVPSNSSHKISVYEENRPEGS